MKKKLCLGIVGVLILASVTVLFSAGTVEAHPPDEVSIDYDMEEEELTVDLTHSVGDPQDHYIENVVVEVDGETEIDEEYDEQPDDTSFQYTYDLVAEPGSTIEATAYCNQFGSGSDTYDVEEEYIVVDEFTVNDEEEDVRVELEEELVIYAEVSNNMDEEAEMIVSVEEDGEGIHSWEETVPAGESGVIDHVYDPHPDAWYPAEYEVLLEVFDQEDESLHQQVIEVEVYDEADTFDLTISIEGEGSVTVEWDDRTEVVEDEDSFAIAEDTEVTLTAEADDDWEFVSWDIPEDHEDFVDEEEETITFPLHTDFSTTANFEEDDDGIPGFTAVLLIIAVVVAVLVYRNNKE